MIRDSLRDLLMETRATTGERSVTIVVIASDLPEQLFGRVEGLEAIAADPFVTLEFRAVAAREERLELLNGFKLGGVFGPSWPYDRNLDISMEMDYGVAADETARRRPHKWWYIPFWSWRDPCSGFKLWKSDGDTFFSPPPPDSPVVRRIAENMAFCPPVLWINLDRAEGRRRHMERMFDAFGVIERRRIRAVEVKDISGGIDVALRLPPIFETLRSMANYDENDENFKREARLAACSASHILALREYLERYPEEPFAIVMEDDVTLELSPLWRKPLWAYLKASDAIIETVVQLGVIALDDVGGLSTTDPVPRLPHWYSTVAYAIRREYAASLVASYFDPESNSVDLSSVPTEPTNAFHPEVLLYGGSAVTLPLFNYLGTESDIDPNNPINHAICKGKIRSFWYENGPAFRFSPPSPPPPVVRATEN